MNDVVILLIIAIWAAVFAGYVALVDRVAR